MLQSIAKRSHLLQVARRNVSVVARIAEGSKCIRHVEAGRQPLCARLGGRLVGGPVGYVTAIGRVVEPAEIGGAVEKYPLLLLGDSVSLSAPVKLNRSMGM